MNTTSPSEHHSSRGEMPDDSRQQEFPAVLARVPWLKSADAAEPEDMPAAMPSREIDAGLFHPHSVVASADVGVTDWDTSATRLRVDPPQPLSEPAEQAPATSASSTRQAAEELYRQPISYAVKPPTASPRPATAPQPAVDGGLTHLRFDPSEAPSQHATEQQTADKAPEASAWHHWISEVDNFVRQYHRVIVLAALLTAAGLMMLVVESQGSVSEPTADDAFSATVEIGEPDHADQEPLPLVAAPATPLLKEATTVATAKGPQRKAREAAAATAASGSEQTLLSEETSAATECDESCTQLPAPDTSSDWIVATPQEQSCEESDVTPEVSPYPSTDAPELGWPPGRNVARLSQEIHPVNESTTK